MRLIAAVRAPTESESAITERLNALFAVESERVANAAVLAEILAPLLSEKTNTPIASVAPAQPDPSPTTTPPAAAPPKPRRGSIADFIDDMIAQEMPPERDGPGNQRRAS